jgi:hypothetical protein
MSKILDGDGDVTVELRGVGVMLDEVKEEMVVLRKTIAEWQSREKPETADLDMVAMDKPHARQSAYAITAAWQICGVGFVAGALLVGAIWWIMPTTQPVAERLLRSVDVVLRREYKTLSRPAQEDITAAYRRAGVIPPGERGASR